MKYIERNETEIENKESKIDNEVSDSGRDNGKPVSLSENVSERGREKYVFNFQVRETGIYKKKVGCFSSPAAGKRLCSTDQRQ